MALFTAFDINATGMTAERFRMDTISQNVANANTTRTRRSSDLFTTLPIRMQMKTVM